MVDTGQILQDHEESLRLATAFHLAYQEDKWSDDTADKLEAYKDCRRRLPKNTHSVRGRNKRYGSGEAFEACYGAYAY